ncbi:hypothetical protein Xind_03705 [Xenorhabdus indica]|nr:hypothetical protein [Xenorhabdus indica]
MQNLLLKMPVMLIVPMFRSYGGFAEYFIWRDDFNERVKANEALDKIKNYINHIIN